MQEDWKTYVVTDFIEINPKVLLKSSKKYSFVEMKDLVAGKKYVLPSGNKQLKGGARFKNYDTLFARITPCLENGKICQVKCLENELGFGSTEFLVFRGRKGVSDTDFVYYLATTPFFRTFSESKMIGTSGRQRIAKEAYRNFEISLPPLPEQRAIASILSALDDKIELNFQTNQTLEEMAMTLYKHWFVDFGPFQVGNFVDSELGLIPEGWALKTLPELGNIFYGKMPKKDSLQDIGYPVYSGYRYSGRYPVYNCEKGKVIVVARGVGGTGDVKITSERCFLTNLSICLNNELEILNNHLLFYFLKRNGLDHLRTGSAQPQITINDLNSVIVLVPPSDIQTHFLKGFKLLTDQIELNLQESLTLNTLRDSLLPKLISGEVRVRDAEKEITYVLAHN